MAVDRHSHHGYHGVADIVAMTGNAVSSDHKAAGPLQGGRRSYHNQEVVEVGLWQSLLVLEEVAAILAVAADIGHSHSGFHTTVAGSGCALDRSYEAGCRIPGFLHGRLPARLLYRRDIHRVVLGHLDCGRI